MNKKMAINTCLSTTESKKQTKQTRVETDSWIRRAFDGCQMGEGYMGMGEEVRGLRNSNR